MNHSLLVLPSLCLLVLSIGCGSSDQTEPEPMTSNDDTITRGAAFDLAVSDTLSSDVLSDYGIMGIDDISGSSSGYIALLDGISSTVNVIAPSGEVINTGGSGNGPGEYQWPRAIAISDDGSVAVSDFLGGFVRILNPDLESYQDISGFVMANPGKLVLLDSGELVGMRIMFTADDGQNYIGHQSALWSITGPEPSLVYTEDMHPFSINDFGWSLIAPFPMTASSEGIVYTADVSTETYLLTSYAPDGTEIWSVERPLEQTEKTQEEMDIEEDIVTRMMQQSAHQAEYTPEPYHYAVSDLSLGPDGNLWARRPGADNVFFDVFDPADGDYLYSAETDLSFDLILVTPAGILATVQNEPQPLLLLEVQRSEN